MTLKTVHHPDDHQGLPIQGICDARFEPLRDAFAANFASGAEIGASVSVWVDGVEAVQLWAGYRNIAKTEPWQKDTIVNVASTTKAFATVCLLQLVEQGEIGLDAPVSAYWPEFAAAGKEGVTVRQVLSHRAGLPVFIEPIEYDVLFDWEKTCAMLARQHPSWEPGTRHGYHPVSFGYLVGELIHRISGQMPGHYLQEHVCGPLGLDFYIGLADADLGRVAEFNFDPASSKNPTKAFESLMKRAAEPGTLQNLAFTNPPAPEGIANSLGLRKAQMPASNGHGTAAAVGRLYAALARGGELDGARILKPETIKLAREEQAFGTDALLGVTSRFGLGFMLRHDGLPIGPNSTAFGHPGAGGSMGFADPETRLGFGYVMNNAKPSFFGSETAYRLVQAAYECL